MAKAKSKKKKRKQVGELIILIILLFVSAGLVTAMLKLYQQQKKQAEQSADMTIPQRQEETQTPTPAQVEAVPIETAPAPEIAPDVPEEMMTETEAMDENQLLVEQKLQEMSLEEKIYQMFIVTPETLVDNAVSTVVQTGAMTEKALQEKPVGGIVYFSKNLDNEEQVTEMLSKAQEVMQTANYVGLWIAVDEEGGTVARVADSLGTTAYENMAVYGEQNQKDEVLAMGKDIADDISQFGFNLDFAPVADVYIDPNNELQDRIFSDDPAIVSDMVTAMVQGLQDSGQVSATLKHFPGLGAEDGNTHKDASAYIERTYEDLETVDFLPFQSGITAGADFVMVGHQTMSCAEDDLPSDLSKTVITDWLRGNLQYHNIVITDAHNMNTITENYSSGEAALLAFQAGADIVLMPDDLNDAFQTVYDAVNHGDLPEERINESVRRILTVKAKHHLL